MARGTSKELNTIIVAREIYSRPVVLSLLQNMFRDKSMAACDLILEMLYQK